MTHILSFFEKMMEKINEGPVYVRDIIFFAPAGMFIGFLLKNFGKQILIITITIAAMLWLGNYFNVLMIDVKHVKVLLGMEGVSSWGELYAYTMQWMYEHSIGCITFALAIFIGWKLGA